MQTKIPLWIGFSLLLSSQSLFADSSIYYSNSAKETPTAQAVVTFRLHIKAHLSLKTTQQYLSTNSNNGLLVLSSKQKGSIILQDKLPQWSKPIAQHESWVIASP